MRYRFVVLFTLVLGIVHGQVNPEDVEIIRDSYGVPHIYGKTDADTAYGLAWAHAEDNFVTIQKAYLAGNGMLSRWNGKQGIGADFIAQFIQSEETVELLYHTLSDEFIAVLQGYTEGLNSYAKHNPDEVLLSSLFPITPKKLLIYSQLQLFLSNEGDRFVESIVRDRVVPYKKPIEEDVRGSNLIALSSRKTGTNESFLAINTHQPLEGPTSWYEAHLVSEEGTNIIGATFPGAPCILTGANEYLGWTHTVNYPDKADVFQLEMKNRTTYIVDGEAHQLVKKKAKMYVRFFGMRIPVSKVFYESIYGPTLRNKAGVFAVRTPSTTNINALEQWWRMNKARSFSEFYSYLEWNAIPGYNIGYADRNDTIFYISNGKIPKRDSSYNWRKVVPGNTKKTLWNSYYTTQELPQVIAPKSGYVYNANHSPFFSTSPDENPNPDTFPKAMNFENYNNNRSTRLFNLLSEKDTLTYEDFKRVKYDHSLPTPLNYNFVDFNAIFAMNPDNYPDVADLLMDIQNWDRVASADSYGAGAFAVLYYSLGKYYSKLGPSKVFNKLLIYTCLKDAKKHLLKHFKTTSIRLGDFQKLVRGDKELPIFGLPDVVTAMRGSAQKNGTIKINHGESYIALIRFGKNKTKVASIICYGSSNHPDSPHYSDQMEMYRRFDTKPMHFDRENVIKDARRIYHPN
ncbi:MAG: penicillin acylase family protein [Flavobacteriales bacterium]|nr:penicillin acylase family protein [Flavobacteriales bacterium]